jgi:hypothetical protein
MNPAVAKQFHCGPEKKHKYGSTKKFNQQIIARNRPFASPAFAKQKKITKKRNIFKPSELPAAMDAPASARGDFYVIAVSPNQTVDKTADNQAKNKNHKIF